MTNSNSDKDRTATERQEHGTECQCPPEGLTPEEVLGAVKQFTERSFDPQFRAEILPQPAYLDRTKPDRDRFLQRLRPQVTKNHLKDLLRRGGDIFKSVQCAGINTSLPLATNAHTVNREGIDYTQYRYPTLFQGVYVASDAGRKFVPADAGYMLPVGMASLPIGIGEPRWRPGRDKPGSGGGGPDASDDPADLVLLPISWEELAELLALLFDLPWLLAKDEDKILAYKVRIRGLKKTGPQARLDEDATQVAWLERWRATYNANPDDWPQYGEDDIPDKEEFPLNRMDERFKRVEEQWDPDSKAVVFFEEDSSGSMGGEPIAIARFYFLLNLIWLRGRYGEVDVVMISHNAQAFRVETEDDFFAIDAGGGTLFSPAHELAMQIADAEYPSEVYNRYAFHATDGYNFEDARFLAEVIERMVTEGKGNFNFFGYLEIDTYGFGFGWGGTSGMQAINLLSDSARQHVGSARVKSMDDIPDAMREIVSKDPVANET